MFFGVLDERRNPAPVLLGVTIGQPTCMASAVLSSLSPTSAVVYEFSGYTDDCGCALVRQTSGLGNFVAGVEQLNQPTK
ncbi:hypothetical protein [Rhodococcus globerulus]|uniref:hypothetical protein n=1 Tax=Rhodococcus globerulus TaxID=33008 RepID=UPI000B2F98CC|nr:hypothetical protein [Rhodococcus globerulus]